MEKSIFQMGIFIEDNIKMVDSMELEGTNGRQKDPFMKGILKMGWGMGRENGKKAKQNTMVAIVRVWNKVMESSTSPVEISTKAIFFRIKKKDTGRCFGLMVAFTKDNGKTGLKMGKDRFTCLVGT